MKLQEKIGARITELRKHQKLSQQQFAYEADIERSFLTNIEKGRKNISISTLQKITNALNISIHDFFKVDQFKENDKEA
jgi:transcriptional regulator with XRE-family HTH domain